MEEQTKFYQQIVDSQILLRKTIQEDRLLYSMESSTDLLDIVDKEITTLSQMIIHLKDQNK